MIDFQEKRSALTVQNNIESKDLETYIVHVVLRLTQLIMVCQLGLHSAHCFDYEFVDLLLNLWHVCSFSFQKLIKL